MTRTWNHRTLLFVGPAILLAGVASVPAQSTPALKATPPASNAQQAAKLVVQLRAPKITEEARKQLIQQLMELGEEGPRKLAVWADGELSAKLSTYASRFEKAAGAVVADRVKQAGGTAKIETTVAEHRTACLAASRNKNLTKEQVKSVCDPAIAKLTELMMVTAEQAAESKSDLAPLRAEVLALADVLRTAIDKVPEAKRKGLPERPADAYDQELANRESVLALLATPMTKADRDVLQGNIALATKIDSEEASAIAEVNRIRVLLGIGALPIDVKLCVASRDHSKDMAEKKFFDHTSPIPGKETPWKRAALAGTSASAENIYMGNSKGTAAIKGWWYSPGHHLNMMGNHHRVGVGRYQEHFTQMFGG